MLHCNASENAVQTVRTMTNRNTTETHVKAMNPIEQAIYDYIGEYARQNQAYPTVREMAVGTDYAKSTIQKWQKRMLLKGYLRKVYGARGIRLGDAV